MSKKKKKVLSIVIGVIFLLILFFPYKHEILEDGNSDVYSSLTYKIVNWCHETDIQYGKEVYFETKVYFFPNNRKSNEKLKQEHYSNK
ncbi:hypothetical protein [Anaeromicropila populeti]|uniref:Uncharacterized protein n=1 Tax=Anaeromicropila populeti TaxID=37658 RepID=A0A1I6LJY3_9FIRM|nr:hypothetical protein [Anaeromicropila populeti]SFS03600.1 hypothetical protein SAMN05661086_03327 [Anaeromicropila populeti]